MIVIIYTTGIIAFGQEFYDQPESEEARRVGETPSENDDHLPAF